MRGQGDGRHGPRIGPDGEIRHASNTGIDAADEAAVARIPHPQQVIAAVGDHVLAVGRVGDAMDRPLLAMAGRPQPQHRAGGQWITVEIRAVAGTAFGADLGAGEAAVCEGDSAGLVRSCACRGGPDLASSAGAAQARTPSAIEPSSVVLRFANITAARPFGPDCAPHPTTPRTPGRTMIVVVATVVAPSWLVRRA